MDDHTEDQGHERGAFWRGEIQARLRNVEAGMHETRESIRQGIASTASAIDKNRADLVQKVEALTKDFQDARLDVARMLYKIVGIGMVAAAILPILLQRMILMLWK